MGDLRIRDLVIEYATGGGEPIRPIHGLSLDVPAGSLVVVLGPSGCGKTTLLSCLGGILSPTSGQILFGATDVTTLGRRDITSYRRRTVGIVFQAFNLVPSLTALENVMVPMWAAGWTQWSAQERARDLLTRVGLADRTSHHPGQLSGGQQQRVAVARALALDPPLILADEPTAQLDYVRAGEVVQLLRVLAAGDRVVVVATHDTRIVPLADIVIQLSPTAVPTRPQQAPVLLGPGSVLLEQGTVEDLIYVVTEGEVEIAPDSAGAGDGLLKIGKPDQYAGQLGPMVRIPRSATVRAPREATVVSYTVDAFRQQFGRPPVPDVPNEPAST
ncbi:ATP-binding cassette domain-containing protein [Mycobacterium sp. SVM_VP21]|uniref:Glutamine ABC transporter ATP-binding protein n=1 Tax=Mycolicibacter virginiensis TaxID=1795032 RepID=A0A9X7IS20_9MYCO|nr:ATP-binding cassette domain-containing protein [Mycolicibacter virginiensis]PQM54200.1 glutamine ABC transporter ATP-binding protein [Mycolicibacter virginiensis]UVO13570.1 ATP-binding cassette domain-containing protein [Mycobacterium sp. SVM_VP21]